MRNLHKKSLLAACIAGSMVGTALPTKADTLVVILDVSGSTPVIQPNFLRAALPMLSDQIRALPVKNSRVKVFTVGDDKAEALTIEQWVQRRPDAQGDTANTLANKIPAAITQYLNTLRTEPGRLQRESSLSPAFLDASKWCQSDQPCTIIFFTDGMEYQPRVIEWPRQYKKPIPSIPGLDLKGAKVVMYGIGQGTDSRVRVAAEQHWERWLTSHNAGVVDLRRL
jgi:hypothetical protein